MYGLQFLGKHGSYGFASSLWYSVPEFLGLEQTNQANSSRFSVCTSLLNLTVNRNHGFSIFAIGGKFPLFSVASIQAKENRRVRPRTRKSSKEGTAEGDEYEYESTQSSSDSSRQRDVVALFRRIRSSIAEAESKSDERRHSITEDQPSDTLRNILRQSEKKEKGKRTKRLAGKGPIKISSLLRKDEGTPNNQSPSNCMLMRPPSSFVRKSPIPSPSSPRGDIVLNQDGEVSIPPANVIESKSPSIEKMKLPELKGIAKARGIKGYSRMKKSELVNLLRH